MIDVHAHIIPKIDDGSTSFEESYKMLERAKKAGFTDIIATSHYMEKYYEVDSIKRHAVVEAMNKVIKERGLDIKIHTREWNLYYIKFGKIDPRKKGIYLSR